MDFVPAALGYTIFVGLLTTTRIPTGGIALATGDWLDLYAHVVCFALMSGLWVIALAPRTACPHITAWVVTMAVGALTEWMQGISTYRTADPLDFIADSVGGGLAAVLLFGVATLKSYLKK